jgi:hypothetical protein
MNLTISLHISFRVLLKECIVMVIMIRIPITFTFQFLIRFQSDRKVKESSDLLRGCESHFDRSSDRVMVLNHES